MRTDLGVHLVRTDDRSEDCDALARTCGGRVGAAGVLADLDRTGRPGRVPGRDAVWGFRWDEEDDRSRRWWPQGITGSGEHAGAGGVEHREVLLTSAYSRTLDGAHMGARISVVDVTDRGRVRYRHVLLVDAFVDEHGQVDLRPVTAHAGGLAWHGPYLHVAATARGLLCFRLDDIVAAGPTSDRIGRGHDGLGAFGYRYLLPLRFEYRAGTGPGVEPLRYSFVSLDRTGESPGLVVGEYGTRGATTRLARYPLDPVTALLRVGPDRAARPVPLGTGVQRMQGATLVDGRLYVTTSEGTHRRGSLWTGEPGALRRRRCSLPVGPEDISYCAGTDQLWSLSEHPGRRHVFAVDRRRVG